MFHLIYRNQGEVYAAKTTSTANGVTTTLLDQKGYDPSGRLTREWHSINGGTPVLVSSVTYDEIGRMSSNALGNGIVTTAFTYDIQNRLRKINDPANLGTKPFALELQYNAPNVSGATAQFAGNISAARWKHLSGSEQTCYYNYDSYSRMTDGIHGGGNSEQYIGYDSNGNINALTRTGAQAAGLGYTYSGNKLTSLTKDGTPYSYAYDSNGNTTTDGLRGMTIAYNYLNLPKTVTKGSDVLTYIYDAAGSKLAEKINTTVNNFYTGAIVYKGDKTIDYIPASTGLIRKVGADFIRQYNINDHLGNVRAVVNQSGTIEQANDYYPYGLAFSYNNLDKNRYLYNGKELQNQSLATMFFGVYDYGARYYDPVIGRWNSVDPMAEKYHSTSPYAYCVNNPVLFIDPNGQEIWIYYNDAEGNQQKLQYTQGMKYEGDNSFVSASITALNQMNGTEIGGQVLGGLVSSKNQFNFTSTFAKDKDGNEVKDALSFAKSENGGGEIHAGALLGEKMQEGQKLESTAHELFHGYQYEKGQTLNGGLATVNNEVGAYLFGRAVYYSYQMSNGLGYFDMPWGNGTQAGNAYNNAMISLLSAPSFNYSKYSTAVNNFKAGSSVNVSKAGVPGLGLYRNFNTNTTLTNPLIKNFFPLVR